MLDLHNLGQIHKYQGRLLRHGTYPNEDSHGKFLESRCLQMLQPLTRSLYYYSEFTCTGPHLDNAKPHVTKDQNLNERSGYPYYDCWL